MTEALLSSVWEQYKGKPDKAWKEINLRDYGYDVYMAEECKEGHPYLNFVWACFKYCSTFEEFKSGWAEMELDAPSPVDEVYPVN